MPSRSRLPAAGVLVRVGLVMLALTLVIFAGNVTSTALAQERPARSWSLRNLFTFPRRERVPEPATPQEDTKAKSRTKSKSRTKAVAKPAEPPVEIVEKLPDAKNVLVVGDFIASGAAEGLQEVFATNPRVRIVDRSNGSSGFAREDYFDWPGAITDMIETEKPAAIVVAIGANDRQQMRIGGKRETLRSEAWTREYTARATSFASAVGGAKVPLVWVGMPAFKSTKSNTDMLAFNEIFRTVTGDASGEFVDVWDGFVDENGVFVMTGPDINGQPVRLRAGDGINLTAAGKRKMAFYAEKPLKKILGEAGALQPEALPSAALPAGPGVPLDRTVPVSLSDPELDGGAELLGLQVTPKLRPRSPGERLAIEGVAPAASPGRADDFSWPREQAPAAATIPPTDEKTTAIRN